MTLMQHWQPTHPSSAEVATAKLGDAAYLASAMVDGELSSEAFSEVWSAGLDSPDLDEAWHMQHLIGEALRKELGGSRTRLDVSAARAYAREVVQLAQASTGADPQVESAVAPPDVVPPSQAVPTPVGTGSVHVDAANDSVFRWKAVAGLASFSAILSVAWNVWWSAGNDASLQLAKVPVAAPAAVTAEANATVLVATGSGVMERDPRLDALIHAHRQHGGGTALQLPAGFMRAATHATPNQP